MSIPNNVPNLDAMSQNELSDFWNLHGSGTRFIIIFPKGGAGTKKAANDLANYAMNKSTAMRMRLEGRIQDAEKYERICQRVYNSLPTWARW